jgi:hypothetical protein
MADPDAIPPPDATSADRAVTVKARRDILDLRCSIFFVPPYAVVKGPAQG